MRIDGLAAEQIISLALLMGTVDYFELLDYDVIDWLEWYQIQKN